jgi:hypothetical protein
MPNTSAHYRDIRQKKLNTKRKKWRKQVPACPLTLVGGKGTKKLPSCHELN